MSCEKAERLESTRKAAEIVSAMSLEEKVRLMSGRVSMESLLEDFFKPDADRHYNWYPYPAGGNERLGVPELKFCDGPRGVVCGQSTCFPVAMGRGATFDPDLEERIGEAVGEEIRAQGGNFYGGVCVNMPYNPGWGRSQEVYGEETFHLGKMGSAMVRGVQRHNVIACVKHFAFNSMENARFKVDVRASARTEREVFLPHFKDCVDAGAASVMSAYNSYMGSPCGHSRHLLSEILKDEWGFDGFVVSDFVWGVKETDAAAKAGLDVEMCHTKYYGKSLEEAVKSGRVSESAIDAAALRIVRTLLAFSEAKDPRPSYPKSLIACKEHVALALESAEKSMTLLKNEGGVLPLRGSELGRLAVIGKLADSDNIGDHGSSRVFPPTSSSPLAGLRAALPSCELLADTGADPERAAALARSADAAVLVVGYSHDDEGEFVAAEGGLSVGGDRKSSLGLHSDDIGLIRAVAAANPKTIVVLIGGNMIMVEEWKKAVPAILMAYYPGMEGGKAIARTLLGDSNPGGKLPFAVPAREGDLPPVDWEAGSITYEYYHGYQKLQKEGAPVSYPYGYGLSYTSFELRDPEFGVSADAATASCTLKNVGSREGDEVLQFYVGFARSRLDRPVKALRGFSRIRLAPGEERRVSISCPLEKLRYYDEASSSWKLERITYDAYIGTSSDDADLLRGTFDIC